MNAPAQCLPDIFNKYMMQYRIQINLYSKWYKSSKTMGRVFSYSYISEFPYISL